MAQALLLLIRIQSRSQRQSLYVISPFDCTSLSHPEQALVVVSCVSLVATVGLLCAIAVRRS